MNNPYDLHSWSKQYREDALRGARRRHLAERAEEGREPRGPRRTRLAWRNALAPLLRGARLEW